MRKDILYKNPWFSNINLSPAIYHRHDVIFVESSCGRGEIIKVHDNLYDYLINGRVITQRAGRSLAILDELILYVLENKGNPLFGERAKDAYMKGGSQDD